MKLSAGLSEQFPNFKISKSEKMKFINYLEKVAGIDIYGLVSLFIFVLFFTTMVIWVFKSDKKKLKEISEIPLN